MALVKLNVNTNNTLNLSFYSACGCNEHHTRRFPQVEYDCFELREPPSRYLLKTLCGGAKPVECFVAGRVCPPDFILNIISLPAKLTFNNVFSLCSTNASSEAKTFIALIKLFNLFSTLHHCNKVENRLRLAYERTIKNTYIICEILSYEVSCYTSRSFHILA